MSSSCTSSRLADYHVHPDYSIDAEGSIDDYCRAALERGIGEICFTTHHDAEPRPDDADCWVVVRGRRMRVTEPYIESYAADVRSAAATYGCQGLVVRLGFEIGWWPGVEGEVARITAACQPDYLLGSVHWAGDYCVAYPAHARAWLGRGGAERSLAAYYRQYAEAASSGLFDCLGHVDVFRRTLHEPDEGHLDLPLVREAAAELMSACVRTGTGLEINTRLAPYDARLICPGPRLLGMAVAAGVTTMVTGSDSHTPAALGAGLVAGAAAAKDAGLGHLTSFAGRRRSPAPLL
jgi:histidinol-phosphatase (PHP family)